MSKLERQDQLTLNGGAESSLRLVAGPGRPLTKAQKKFSRLVRRVEDLRADAARSTAIWDRFLKAYQERIHPLEARQIVLRRELVLALGAFWRAPKGLGARQRDLLEELLMNQLTELMKLAPDALDESTRELAQELSAKGRGLEPALEGGGAREEGDPREEAGGEGGGAGGEEAEPSSPFPPYVEHLLREMGIDPTAFRFGMSPEEINRVIWEQTGIDLGSEAGQDSASQPRSRKRSARQEAAARKAEERAAQREEARKRTVGAIYKQLAKVLHPDLEPDPARREEKHRLMQQLTTAYREGDLHTLLRLELEWIHREEGNLEKLGDEKLDIYTELLSEQVQELENELRQVAYQPRFAMVARFARSFDGLPDDVGPIIARLDAMNASLAEGAEALRGRGAKGELREMLRQHAALRIRRPRFPFDLDDDFSPFG